ncbi:MAG: ATP-binding protein [Betaproteobacteria bacterium]
MSLRRLSVLYELSMILSGSLDLDRELTPFLEGLCRTLGLEVACIAVVPKESITAPLAPRVTLGVSRRERGHLRIAPDFVHRLEEAGGQLPEFAFPNMAGAGFSILLAVESERTGILSVLCAQLLSGEDRLILNTLGGRLAVALHYERARHEQDTLNREIREATERARALAEHANRSKTEFLAIVSHEIRTPLNGIVGMVDVLLGSALTDQQRESIEAIQHSADTLSDIVNKVLDFTRIEAGRLELEHVSFDLPTLLNEAISIVRVPADLKGLRLSAMVASRLPPTWVGDPFRLRQILVNLLGNAVKFTEQGSVTVRVDLEENSRDDPALRFEVEDTGPGIAPEVAEHLFEPFTQADRSMSRRYGGTGLGLSIARRLVDLMGGHIGVSAASGTGAQFWFVVRLGAPESALAPEMPESIPRADLPFRDVLVAEDNLVNQQVTRILLERAGCRVVVANDGREALLAFEAGKFDVVLMDCQMPGVDGFEATRQIRRRERQQGNPTHTPIIAVTANALDGDRDRCLREGMDDFVAKPFRIERLLDTMRKVCAGPGVVTKVGSVELGGLGA